MNAMPLQLGWDEIVLRLALTVVAGEVALRPEPEHRRAG